MDKRISGVKRKRKKFKIKKKKKENKIKENLFGGEGWWQEILPHEITRKRKQAKETISRSEVKQDTIVGSANNRVQ